MSVVYGTLTVMSTGGTVSWILIWLATSSSWLPAFGNLGLVLCLPLVSEQPLAAHMASTSLPSYDHLALVLSLPVSWVPIHDLHLLKYPLLGISPGECLLVAYLEVSLPF